MDPSAASMPDVRASPCDHSEAILPAGRSLHSESPCSASPPGTSCPRAACPTCDALTYSSLQRSPGFRGNAALTSLGLRYCPSSSVLTLRSPSGGSPAQSSAATTSSRLCHSMENLHWVATSDRGVFGAPCRIMDGEFIFRCGAQWGNGTPEALYPCRVPLRQDLALFPQWLFPSLDERVKNGTATKGLKEKFRFQSAGVTEPNKPLRAPTGQRDPRAACLRSPEDIKREALQRLRLCRQRSSPDLSLCCPAHPVEVAKSRTAESLFRLSPPGPRNCLEAAIERRRPPLGRLHIPTFEEFKRMRQKESRRGGGSQGQAEGGRGLAQSREDSSGVALAGQEASGGHSGEAGAVSTNRSHPNSGQLEDADGGTAGQVFALDSITVPICSSPTPRSPLQPRPAPQMDPTGTSLQNPSGGLEAPSACCASLLLDGSRITRIKDGVIGSAIELIKKSCSAEGPAYQSRDPDSSRPSQQSDAVSMTTAGHSTEARNVPGGGDTGCPSSPGCRRSSSDAAYEPPESARAQRERRLRPHFSDPMPADATKRKQLEMKIAVAARLHSLRRDKEEDSRPVSEARSGDMAGEGQQRWSDVSSLSADSGVVGLGDEREDEEEPRAARLVTRTERGDSDVDSEQTRSWEKPSDQFGMWRTHRPCPDCSRSEPARADGMCARCLKQRTERKEAILELLNTEASYGEDLRIIKEEFYSPMQGAGLLTAEQLVVVFSNVQELIDVNEKFTERLQESIDRAFDQGDEDLQTVCIGEIFLEFVTMLPAFQTYCLQQSASVNMLNSLEKEKELLRIFLDVSQNDNTALRRMNLRSFLMAPLQRVTKYPLLLSRISKATAECHPDRGRLREAKSHVESHLEHINTKTRQEGAPWSLRSFRRDSRRNREAANVEIREASMRTVGWTRESTRFVMEGPLQLAQPADGQWVKKGSRALKFQNVQSLLMVHTQRAGDGPPDGMESPEPVRDGVLVLIKDKSSGKFAVLREPIRLSNCVVSSDPECDDTFELLDIPREAFVFRAVDKARTQQWFRQIRRYARDLGPWRKRRNALPNIMINTAQSRS
ncbi:uncharacterized protein arhgef49 [Paramormyrops kingsleyae]|uniref:uncharacterized protein arhgef49 n=1 Tax=Paramormyrops kingsleyae TaxID=1676925 RepID=UPI003B978767